MRNLCVVLLLMLVACSGAHAQETPGGFPVLKGPYLGQRPPGKEPEVFAEGILNEVSMIHGKIVFSPDGCEVYWECMAAPVQSRWRMKTSEDGVWSKPEASFLSVQDSEAALCFSPDGQRAYYHSRRPRGEEGGSGDKNIWYRERAGEGWGEPQDLGAPLNSSDLDEWGPAVTGDGTVYFCREAHTRRHGPDGHQSGAVSVNDVYSSRLVDGRYNEPVRLGSEVNSESHDLNPAVAADNSYIVFTSNRPGGYSAMMNLYVSFRTGDGTWSDARCLSEVFEIANIWFPSLTSDGKYLFFCGGFPTSGGYTDSDYYWVSTGAIEELRPGPAETE